MEPLARGTRIVKTNSKPDDTHKDGAPGVVLDAIGPTPPECEVPGVWGYFVGWDDLPGVKVFIAGSRIARIATC